MVLNTDPDYGLDGPDPNIVSVVGDLGDLASVDVWAGSGSFDSDDDSSLDGWLGSLDSGYEPTQFQYFTTYFDDEENDYSGRTVYRHNLGTGEVEINHDYDDSGVWHTTTLRFTWLDSDSWYESKPPSWLAVIGGHREIPYEISWQSFHTVKDYFTPPNGSSSLGGRSWGVPDYGTLNGSKTQEVIQDPTTVPAKGDGIAPGLKPTTTSVGSSRDVGGGFFERRKGLLEDAKNVPATGSPGMSSGVSSAIGGRRQELLEDAKGVSGTGNLPTTTGRRQELLDEAKLTPSSGNASSIGSGRKQEQLEGSKGNSFNTKNSLEEKSFKNSVGEKNSRSTFTGEKVLSQQGAPRSFKPLGGTTRTFSGTGTRAPTSGKSLPRGF